MVVVVVVEMEVTREPPNQVLGSQRSTVTVKNSGFKSVGNQKPSLKIQAEGSE